MIKQEHLAINKYDSAMDANVLLTSRIAYDGNGNPEYMGLAAPGVASDAGQWMIRKITYDGSQRPLAITFADGTVDFDKVWDDRATYSFS